MSEYFCFVFIKGTIRLIFDIFCEENVISEGMFWKWKKNSDQEEHMKSVRRLKDFFTRQAQVNRNMQKEKGVSSLTTDTADASNEGVSQAKDQPKQVIK